MEKYQIEKLRFIEYVERRLYTVKTKIEVIQFRAKKSIDDADMKGYAYNDKQFQKLSTEKELLEKLIEFYALTE